MNGFSGVQEKGRGPGAGERRRDLAADDAGLAHASDDHAALAVAHQHDSAREPLIEAIDQRQDRGGFRLEHSPREGQVRHA